MRTSRTGHLPINGLQLYDDVHGELGASNTVPLMLRRPPRVGKLVTLPATFRQDGWYPLVLHALEGLSGDLFGDTPVGEAFRQHTADPEAFASRSHLDLGSGGGPRADDHRVPG